MNSGRALTRGWETAAASTTLSTQAGTATRVARLFVIFFAAHFLLDAAAFDELAKAANGFVNRFAFADLQLNHESLLVSFALEKVKPKPSLCGWANRQRRVSQRPTSAGRLAANPRIKAAQ